MLTKDVILKFHEKVPFPWTQRKIKKAGHDPIQLFLELGRQLEQCEDKDTPDAKAVLEILNKLKLLDARGGG